MICIDLKFWSYQIEHYLRLFKAFLKQNKHMPQKIQTGEEYWLTLKHHLNITSQTSQKITQNTFNTL